MSKVTQEFQAVGEERIARAYEQMARKATELQDRVDKLAAASEKGAAQGARGHSRLDEALDRNVGRVRGLAMQYLGLQAIIQAVTEDMQRQAELQGESLDAHRNLAQGQAELFLNTFGQDEATKQKYFAAAQRISAQTGVPEPDVLKSLGRQAGRGINLSAEQIIAAQELATRLGRHTPEQIEPLSTVIQQTMRATGMSAEWSAALAQSGAAAAFPGDPRLQSRFLQQALTGSLANINKPDALAAEQIFELAGALSQAGGEERGEAGRTATISLLAQFDEFREGRGKWAMQVAGRSFPVPLKDAPTRPGDFIDWLRAHPAQMQRFFDKASFEQHYEGIIRRMIMDPSSQVGQLYEGSKEAVRPDIAALQRQLAELERATPQIQRATAASQATATIEQAKARADRDAVTKTLREMRDEAFKIATASGQRHLSAFESRIVYGLRDLGGYLFNEQPERYAGDIAALREEILNASSWGVVNRLDPEERRVYDLLTQLLENAQQQLAELKAANRSGPGASPALNAQHGLQNER